jgi:hypothetical protein
MSSDDDCDLSQEKVLWGRDLGAVLQAMVEKAWLGEIMGVLMIMMHVVGLVSGYTAELQGLYRSIAEMTGIGCEYGERMAK